MEVVKDRKDGGSGSSNKIDKMNVSLCDWRLYDNLKPWLKGMLLNRFLLFFPNELICHEARRKVV